MILPLHSTKCSTIDSIYSIFLISLSGQLLYLIKEIADLHIQWILIVEGEKKG